MPDAQHGGISRRAPPWAWIVLGAAVFAVSSAGVAFSFLRDVPPLTLAGWRLQLTSVIAGLVAAVQWATVMQPDERRRAVRDAWKSAASGLFLALHFGTWVWSLQHTTLSHSLLLVSTSPVIVVGLSLLRRQRLSAGELLGSLAAVAGCAVLAAGSASGKEGQQASMAGDAAAFAAALAIVGHWEVGKVLREYQPVFVYSAPVTALAAACLSLAGLAEGGGLAGPRGAFGWLRSRRRAGLVAYLAVVPGLVGHQGFNTVLKYMPPLSVSLAVQMEPPLGSLLGWAAGVAGPPGALTWFGGVVVLAATAWASVATAQRQAAEERALAKVRTSRLPTIAEAEAEPLQAAEAGEQRGWQRAEDGNSGAPTPGSCWDGRLGPDAEQQRLLVPGGERSAPAAAVELADSQRRS